MGPRQPLLHELAITLRAPTVCLSAPDGQLRGSDAQGVLAGDVRVLGYAVVTVDGTEPEPIAHGTDGASSEHFIGLVRDLGSEGRDQTVWLRRDRTVGVEGMRETFTLFNRSAAGLSAEIGLAVGTDLASVATIRTGEPEPAEADDVAVSLDAPDADAAADGLRWIVNVPARSSASVGWSLSVHDTGAVVAPAETRLDRTLVVEADDPRLAALLEHALDDLDALLLTEPDHPGDVFAAAGAPWYLTLFGRDALWTATLLLPVDVAVAGGTLRTLARSQGRVHDPASGEEPGKILHERRRAARAYIGEDGKATLLPPRYYGTVDATPLWICLLRDAWRWGLPADEVRALLPNLDAALGWIARHDDEFVVYDGGGAGLPNQGWKDSAGAVRFADGTVAEGPVALVEVQGYVHEAALAAAELLEAFGGEDAPRWRAYAADLAARFRKRFWVADDRGPFPALALDGTGAPVDTLTSNVGHLLGTGLLDAEESERIAGRLIAPDMASGFGLRTMSRDAGGYSPLAYHCGAVWPHDTAVVARGLARAGHADAATELVAQLLAAADGFDRRLPELFAGFGTDEVTAAVPYPASCRPQAWAAAAAVEVLRVVLGLSVDVPAGVITLDPPSPSRVGAVSVRGLAVGGGRMDVAIDRDGRVSHVTAPAGFRVVTPTETR